MNATNSNSKCYFHEQNMTQPTSQSHNNYIKHHNKIHLMKNKYEKIIARPYASFSLSQKECNTKCKNDHKCAAYEIIDQQNINHISHFTNRGKVDDKIYYINESGIGETSRYPNPPFQNTLYKGNEHSVIGYNYFKNNYGCGNYGCCASGLQKKNSKGTNCVTQCKNGNCLIGSPYYETEMRLLGGTAKTGKEDLDSGLSYTDIIPENAEHFTNNFFKKYQIKSIAISIVILIILSHLIS